MRIIIFKLIFFASLVSLGKQESYGALVFKVKASNRYSTQYTEVYNKKGLYICKTDLVPYFESKIFPVKKETLERLLEVKNPNAAELSTCKTQISIETFSKNPPNPYQGCQENFPFADFARELNQNCGRN